MEDNNLNDAKYQDLVKKFVLNPDHSTILVEITEKSTNYLANRAECSNAKSSLEESLKKVDELKDVDAHQFASYLVDYLYTNRKR